MQKPVKPIKNKPPRNKSAMEARHREALEMRQRGASYQAIADKLGMSIDGVQRMMNRTLTQLKTKHSESAIMARNLEVARLDRLYEAAEKMAIGYEYQTRELDAEGNYVTVDHVVEPSLTAVARCVGIIEQRARMLGLHAPEKVPGDNTGLRREYVGVDLEKDI